MALRPPTLTSLPSRLLKTTTFQQQCLRRLHSKNSTPDAETTTDTTQHTPLVPQPTPFVPDVPTFLSLIGRQMSKHTSKLPTWDDLFTMSSTQLRSAGIEPTHQRRYLLRWREKFRRGEYGIGGDLKNVVDGAAEVRVVEVPMKPSNRAVTRAAQKGQEQDKVTATITSNPQMMYRVVNLLPGETEVKDVESLPPKPYGFKLYNRKKVRAPYMEAIPGTNGMAGRLVVKEGMWEDKMGRKVDGGERRRAEVRAKKRSEERKKAAV